MMAPKPIWQGIYDKDLQSRKLNYSETAKSLLLWSSKFDVLMWVIVEFYRHVCPKNLNHEICSPNLLDQIIIYFMVIFIVPEQINQIICLFQMLAVNWESVFCISKDFFVIESAFQKNKKTTIPPPQIHDLSSWQLQRDNSFFSPINKLLVSLTIMDLKCVVGITLCNSHKICSKYIAKVVRTT